jgi:hypothetical protein
MDESGRKRGGRLGDKAKEARPLPSLEFDTVRPPGSADADAYSAETVVRALPRELLNELNAAMKPAKVPVIDSAPAAAAPAETASKEASAKAPGAAVEDEPKGPAMLPPAPAAPPEAPPAIEAAAPSAPSASAPESSRSIEAAAPVSTPTVDIEREPTREELGVMSSKRLTFALVVALAALIAVVFLLLAR